MFLVAASQLVLPASAQDPADAAFWKSVFSENHVLDIRIEVSREGWDAMSYNEAEVRRIAGLAEGEASPPQTSDSGNNHG